MCVSHTYTAGQIYHMKIPGRRAIIVAVAYLHDIRLTEKELNKQWFGNLSYFLLERWRTEKDKAKILFLDTASSCQCYIPTPSECLGKERVTAAGGLVAHALTAPYTAPQPPQWGLQRQNPCLLEFTAKLQPNSGVIQRLLWQTPLFLTSLTATANWIHFS